MSIAELPPIYTIGHSTHEPERFAELCEAAGIRTILDVRSHPSSKWVWFNQRQMQHWLPEAGIDYEWLPALGGWRADHQSSIPMEFYEARGVDVAIYAGKFPKQRISKPTPPEFLQEQAWSNLGFYDYSWFQATVEYIEGARDLAVRGDGGLGMVCSEVHWWRCHRSMVADTLSHWGREVVHAMPSGHKARLSAHPDDRLSRYHPDIVRAWEAADPSLVRR